MVDYLPVVEDSFDLVLQCLSGFGVSELVLSDDLLELLASGGELSSDLESGRQKVVVVYQFYEWFDFRSSSNLFLAHFLVNFEWCTLNTSHEGVWILLATLLSFIEILDNNGLLSCSSSGE